MQPPRFTFRQATDDDFNFLFGLHVVTLREYIEPIWGWHPDWQFEYFQKKFDPTNTQIIVVEGLDAGVMILDDKVDELFISLIEILPRFQNRGIGSQILLDLINQAHSKNKPAKLQVLRTNRPAKRLYERLGFSVIVTEENRYQLVCCPGNDQ